MLKEKFILQCHFNIIGYMSPFSSLLKWFPSFKQYSDGIDWVLSAKAVSLAKETNILQILAGNAKKASSVRFEQINNDSAKLEEKEVTDYFLKSCRGNGTVMMTLIVMILMMIHT